MGELEAWSEVRVMYVCIDDCSLCPSSRDGDVWREIDEYICIRLYAVCFMRCRLYDTEK